jgi:NAD(P)H-dependent flavin oxidoreductase YrpB (nitropropane dioxygenase family)
MRTPHPRICDQLGIRVPILGFSPSPDVVVAISRAGGLGVLGAVRYTTADELEAALAFIDANVDGHPYGVDVVMPMKEMAGLESLESLPESRAKACSRANLHGSLEARRDLEAHIPAAHRRFVDDLLARYGVPPLPPEAARPAGITAWIHAVARAQVDVALRHPVRLLANALGSPPADVIAEAHARGVLVAALAGKAEHARSHAEHGVDIIVAQGHEAGGHTGEITTMVLVPEIVRAARDKTVLAAGGIGTGAQIAAALALGAEGVWMGSIWLTTAEYRLEPASESGRSVVTEKLLAATSSDTVRSRVVSGKPARMLRTPWTEAWEAKGSPGTLPMPLQGLLVADAEARIRHHQSRELLGVPVGQIVGQMNEVRPVRDVIERLMSELAESAARVARLCGR